MSIMAPHARPAAWPSSSASQSRRAGSTSDLQAPFLLHFLLPFFFFFFFSPPREHTRFLQTNKAPFNLCLSVQLIVYVHAPACKSSPCSSAIRGWNKPLLVLRAVRRWCVWFACGFCNLYVPKDGGAQASESGANSVPVSVHTFALFMSSELIPTLVI